MRAWYGVLVAASLVVAACWHTKTNPAYCTDSSTCTAPTPTCEVATNTCVSGGGDLGNDGPTVDLAKMCMTSAMCTAGAARFCGSDGNCRACVSGDCGGTTPLCATTGTLSGACVECVDETACASAHKVCDATTATCRACTKHSECGSSICEAGACVDAGSILYVNNNQTPCAGATGTRANAYCDVNAAIAALAGKTHIYVEGSAATYNAISVAGTGTTLTIVGPGKTAAVKAQFSQNGVPALAVSPTTGTSVVVVDGLELIGSGAGSQPGVKCNPTAATVNLTVQDSYVHTSGAAGVDSNACTLGLFRNVITDNKSGVSFAAGTFDIENNLIFSNSSAGPGAAFGAASSGTFRFNTLAKNNNGSGAGGVGCVSTVTITDSIVIGNTGTANQVSGCTLSNTVTGGTDGVVGSLATTPTFVDPATDFHLKPSDANNQTCCVNKASTTPTPPALDVDDTVRPKGGLPDVGAHEVE